MNYQRIIQLFVALLLERKVILITKDFSELSILIETLKALLYPLQWKCITISFLIPKLIDYLDAPVPYIIGISRTMWKEVRLEWLSCSSIAKNGRHFQRRPSFST